ncbi:MAG: hypothetical protein GEV11_19925 [Streptosporangiales bacterium]|nr:hypothetical protein [Streptosporangiales bacterium]
MAGRSAERDLVGLTVLALPRSLYHAVDRLARDELIVPVETTREGRRPERTRYELTGEGRAELTSRLRRLLGTPMNDSTPFMAALSFIGVLSRPEAIAALRSRVAALEAQVAAADATLAGLGAMLPELLLVELEYRRAVMELAGGLTTAWNAGDGAADGPADPGHDSLVSLVAVRTAEGWRLAAFQNTRRHPSPDGAGAQDQQIEGGSPGVGSRPHGGAGAWT